MQIEQLKQIVEAALLASTQPMTVAQLKALFQDEEEVGSDDLAHALEALTNDSAERGIELVEVASGYRYQVRQGVHAWVSRMWSEKPSRYSRALLETLALIAYRQPITRPEIEQIRGVVVSSNIVKTLEEREWIRVVGYRDVPGKPALFGTTRGFLDYFNLKSLDALPPLAEIRDMEDLNPQLRLDSDNDALPARVAVVLDDGAGDEAEPAIAGEAMDDAEIASHEELPVAANDQPDDAQGDAAPSTADEAETHADADQGDASKDTEESRA